MFELAIALSAERLQRVRSFLHAASEAENPDPLGADPEHVLALRGLFFVMLYGYFEYSINLRVSGLLAYISELNIPASDFRGRIRTLVAHGRFQAIENPASGGAPWPRRVQLIDAMDSSDACEISSTVFGSYLQNIWFSSLVQVFDCLGISETPVPSPPDRGYVDELVDKRNAVAHGRSCAAEVGRLYRSKDLHLRLDRIALIVEHVERQFRTFAGNKRLWAAG